MRLNLNEEMYTLLKKCLINHRPDLLWALESITEIDEFLGNELRDAVNDEFLSNGLNSNDEPNELGIKLERLIDQIGRCFM
jgi:hypothetical protein